MARTSLESFNASSGPSIFQKCDTQLSKGGLLNFSHCAALVQTIKSLREATPTKICSPLRTHCKTKDFTAGHMYDVFSYLAKCSSHSKFQYPIGVKLEAGPERFFFLQRRFPLELPIDDLISQQLEQTGRSMKVEGSDELNFITALSITMAEVFSQNFPNDGEIPFALPSENGLLIGRAIKVNPSEFMPITDYSRSIHREFDAIQDIPFKNPRFVLVIDRFIREGRLEAEQTHVYRHWKTVCAAKDFQDWVMSSSDIYFRGGDERFKVLYKYTPEKYAQRADKRKLAYQTINNLIDTHEWGRMQEYMRSDYSCIKDLHRRQPENDGPISIYGQPEAA